MTAKVTSFDVAERAGVSRSAVSRVFTPGASVSDRTAQKVRRAAHELGYRPNVLARSLMTGQSRMIGLVVAYLDNLFYPTVLEKLSTALQAEGYHVLVFMASQKAGNLDQVAEEILDYQVDGLILASVAMTSDLARRCRDTGVPVVLLNRKQGVAGEVAVVSDNFAGGRAIAHHFADIGRTRVAHIAGWEGASTQADREAGFLQGLSERGLSLASRAVGNFDPKCAAECARLMFAGPVRPDAVFVATDFMALSVMDVLRGELDLKVPEDVAVAGFDDVAAAGWPSYEMTSVAHDTDAMVDRAVEYVIAGIDRRQIETKPDLPVTLIIRQSTRA
jgi:DNA-binding LacI/PurR family transcriptional regulator